MAEMILILAGAVVWLEFHALRNIHRSSLLAAQATPSELDLPIETLIARTARDITALLDLRACWFEPFPFDALLPRIEQGRIVLPIPEPGVGPWSDVGVELPIRVNDLTVGRFVLQPNAKSVGVVFPPSRRDRVLAMAGRLGPPLAAALISCDDSRSRQ